jgi:hypothetical protein
MFIANIESNIPLRIIITKESAKDSHGISFIKQLHAELCMVPDWHGILLDDIWRCLELFRAILDKVKK